MILQNLAPESCSRIFLPSLLNSSIRAAGWQRRGFRNRGPVRESGSERRSRCGAACTASVCVWRRAHFCCVRVAGCGDRACWRCVAGMPRACRGHAAALCRGDWVRGVFCTRVVNVRFAWQAAGIVRAGSVLAGRVGGAVPWGLGSGRVARTHDSTRCDLRFAWQVWEFGCIDAPGKVDPRGRCGETCLWTLLRVRFAWPAWGSAHAACVSRRRRREWCERWPRWASFCVAGAGNRAR